jgi:hypothetical protein
VFFGCGGDDDPASDASTSAGGSGGTAGEGTGGSGGTAGATGGSGGTAGATGGSGGSFTAGQGGGDNVLDPERAEAAEIDRFSEDAGMLMVRDDENGLPDPGEPIDFDSGAPFITMGFGPDGEVVQYYNFDVQPTDPAPIYALFHEGEDAPVSGQLNIVGVIPGDAGYNDFWRVNKVTVPDDYVANSITNVDDLMDAGFDMEELDVLVNCPIVPDGSTAELRIGDGSNGLVQGWYDDMVVYYFSFEEAPLEVTGRDEVPLAPIFVTFNVNPDEGGGPPSGFVTEDGSDQTHNVLTVLPEDAGYSPLWSVNVYDNADFDSVSDLDSVMDAEQLDEGVANVNCPIVSIEE